MKMILEWVRRHPWCLWLGYFVFYLLMFAGCELFVHEYHMIRFAPDALIPFNEHFIWLYGSWFIAFPGSLLFTLLTDKDDFVELCALMFTGTTICLLTYVIWPNGIDLRVPFTPHNLSGWLVKALWDFDPSVNVCPSLHCSVSSAVAVGAMMNRRLAGRKGLKALIVLWMTLIILSTLFIKQHSILDCVLGVGVTLVLIWPVYRTGWRQRLARTRLGFLAALDTSDPKGQA